MTQAPSMIRTRTRSVAHPRVAWIGLFFLALAALRLSPTFAAAATKCRALSGGAECFYRCAERIVANYQGCGATGYAVAHGQYYARRFAQWTTPRLSSVGQQWSKATELCLQQALVPVTQPSTSCESFTRVALASHVACYTQNGFCELPLRDLLTIRRTIDRRDRDSAAADEHLAEIAKICQTLSQSASRRWLMKRVHAAANRSVNRMQRREFARLRRRT